MKPDSSKEFMRITHGWREPQDDDVTMYMISLTEIASNPMILVEYMSHPDRTQILEYDLIDFGESTTTNQERLFKAMLCAANDLTQVINLHGLRGWDICSMFREGNNQILVIVMSRPISATECQTQLAQINPKILDMFTMV